MTKVGPYRQVPINYKRALEMTPAGLVHKPYMKAFRRGTVHEQTTKNCLLVEGLKTVFQTVPHFTEAEVRQNLSHSWLDNHRR